jgi:hypothetical protein
MAWAGLAMVARTPAGDWENFPQAPPCALGETDMMEDSR